MKRKQEDKTHGESPRFTNDAELIPSRCRSSAGNTTAETQEDDRTYHQWNMYAFSLPFGVAADSLVDVKLDLQKRIITLNQEPQPLDKYTSYLSRTSYLSLPSLLDLTYAYLRRVVMARFQEWLMDQPLDKDIPEMPREFWPLVGMIGHESYVTPLCLFICS